LAGPLGPRPERMGTEPRASGVTCVTAIFQGAAAALRARKVAASLRTQRDPRLLRWSVGMDLPPRALAICLCRDATVLAEAFRDASWVECWQAADYEIGHWDGLRLRQVARRRTRDRVELGQ